jgi:hypothetical protein
MNQHPVINTSLSKSFLISVLGPTHEYLFNAGKPVGPVRLEHLQPVPVLEKVNRLHLSGLEENESHHCLDHYLWNKLRSQQRPSHWNAWLNEVDW